MGTADLAHFTERPKIRSEGVIGSFILLAALRIGMYADRDMRPADPPLCFGLRQRQTDDGANPMAVAVGRTPPNVLMTYSAGVNFIFLLTSLEDCVSVLFTD